MPDELSPLEAINRKFGLSGGSTPPLPMPSAPAVPEPGGAASPLEAINQKFGLSPAASPSPVAPPQPPQPAGTQQVPPVAASNQGPEPGTTPSAPVARPAEPSPAGVKPSEPEIIPGAFGGQPRKPSALSEAFAPTRTPEIPEEPLAVRAFKELGRFAATANKPVMDVVHGFARGLEQTMDLPRRVTQGDWESETPHVLTALTGKARELASPEKLMDEAHPVTKFMGNLLGGLESYMIPGKVLGAAGVVLPHTSFIQKFGSNLITFGSTDVFSTVGAGGNDEQIRNALLKSIPTAALFTVAQAIPFDKLTKNPWLTKALESTATGTAFAGSHAMGGETDPAALAVSFLTGFGIHAITSGLPQRGISPEVRQKAMEDHFNQYVIDWKETNKIKEAQWVEVQNILDRAGVEVPGAAEPAKTPQPETPTPEAQKEAIFGGKLGETIEGQANRADAIKALVPIVGDQARAERFYDLYEKGDAVTALKEFPEFSAMAPEAQRRAAITPAERGEGPAPMQSSGAAAEVATRTTPVEAATPPQAAEDYIAIRKLVSKVELAGDPAAAKRLNDLAKVNPGIANLLRTEDTTDWSRREPILSKMSSLMRRIEETGDPNAVKELSGYIAANPKTFEGFPRWPVASTEPVTPAQPMATTGYVPKDTGAPPAPKAAELPTPGSPSLPGIVAKGPEVSTEAKPTAPSTPAAPMGTTGGAAENLAAKSGEPVPVSPETEVLKAKTGSTKSETLDESLGEIDDRGKILKEFGKFDSRADVLKNFTREERRLLFPYTKRGAQGPDMLLAEVKGIYPHLFGEFETDADLLRAIIDGKLKPINYAKIEEAHYAATERQAAEDGLDAAGLAKAEADVAREIAAERDAIQNEPGAGEPLDLGWDAASAFGLRPRENPASRIETRLDQIQADYPGIDRDKVAQVIRSLPNAEDGQIVNMAADPEMFAAVARGNLKASEKAQLLKKASDAGAQGGLFGGGERGGDTLFKAEKTAATLEPFEYDKGIWGVRERGQADFDTGGDHPKFDSKQEAQEYIVRSFINESEFTKGLTTDQIQSRLGKFGTVSELGPDTFGPDSPYARGWVLNDASPHVVVVVEGKDNSLKVGFGAEKSIGDWTKLVGEAPYRITGSHTPMALGSFIELARGEGIRTVDHELWHRIEHFFLTPEERTKIIKKYGDNEEARARAYENWNPKETPDTIFQKIFDFAQRIVKAITGYESADDIFAKARSGELFAREPVERGLPEAFAPERYKLSPEERDAEREARKAAGIPLYKDFYKSDLQETSDLYSRLKTPGNQDVPLYEGQQYTNRAGLQIKDETGKVRFLSKKEIYEHFYDPQKPYAEGTVPPGDPRVAPEGTITPPPVQTRQEGFVGTLKAIRQNWAENLSIRKVGELADRTQTSIVEHLGWASQEMDKATAVLDKYDRHFRNMPQDEFIKFMDLAETGQLDQVAPELREAGQAWRRIADGLHLLIADSKGGEFAYWEDWFPRMFKNPEQAEVAIRGYLKSHGRTMTGPESMLKARTQLLLSQSIKPVAEGGLGLELLYPNMVDAMKAKVHESLRYLTGTYIKQDLLDSGFMQEAKLPGPRGIKPPPPAGWVELQDKSLRGFYAHPEVAKALDNFLSRGLRGGAVYDALINPISALQEMFVGLSAFHGMFTTLGNLSHGVGANLPRAIGAALSGDFGRAGNHLKDVGSAFNIVGEVRQGSKLLQERVKPGTFPELSEMVDTMVRGGMRANTSGFMDIWGAKGGAQDFSEMSRAFSDVLRDSKLGIPRKIMQSISWPIMNYFVPRVKANAMYRRLGIELDRFNQENGRAPSREETTQISQQVGREVDNIFGQMVYDNLGMKRALRDSLKLWIGFPGWNIGSGSLIVESAKGITHLLGEASKMGADVLTGNKPKYEPMSRAQRTSMEFYLGMTMVTAVAGTIAMKLLTGQWPQDMKDVFMPRTGGTLANGQPERVRMPTYMRDILSLNHPMNMMAAKENFAIRMFSELTQNQDYFGTQIRDPWASTGEQAKQLTEFGAKSFLPFGVQGYLKSQTPQSKALNIIGITPVPREYSNTPAQNVIDEYNQMMRATTTTKETAELKTLKSALMKLARAQDESGFQEAATQAVSEGKITRQQVKEIVGESQAPPGMSRFTRLPLEWATRTYDAGSDAEKEQWRPYFLKKVMAEKPENLIKNREPVVATLREMGLDEAADAVANLVMPEEPISSIDLTGLGIQHQTPEIGGMSEVDTAIAAALEQNLTGKAKRVSASVRLPSARGKKNPYGVLGL